MKAAGLVFVVLLCAACVTVSPTQTTSPAGSQPPVASAPLMTPQAPTATPEQTRAGIPTPSPTNENTPEPPVPTTPDPNITPDPNATPVPTPVDVLPFLTSGMTVVNLGSSRLSVTVALLDTESTDEFVIGTFDVEPEQVTAQQVIPARLRLEFQMGGSNIGTCTIDVADAEQIQFAAIEGGVVITLGAAEPVDPAEMIVATASRCAAGAA